VKIKGFIDTNIFYMKNVKLINYYFSKKKNLMGMHIY